MKKIYPAIFHPEAEGGYSVIFPDVGYGATQGETIEECVEMAEDFLSVALCDMEDRGKTLPKPTDAQRVRHEPDDIVTLVSVDIALYRAVKENRLVKKTLNIPYKLNKSAEAAGINFSQLLQRALQNELQEAL